MLSLAVKSLEKEFDTILLERSRHGVKLTAEGKLVVNLAENILRQVEQTKRTIQKKNAAIKAEYTLRGEITCYINQGLNYTFFPLVASRFYKSFPQIQLNIYSGNNEEIIAKINQGAGEIGLLNMLEVEGNIISPVLPASLQWQEIIDHHLVALVNRASTLSQYKKISMSTFLKEQISISTEYENIEDYLLTKLLKYYGSPKLKIVNSAALSQQFVIDNQAVSLVPNNNPVNLINMEHLIKIPFRNKFSIKVGFIYCKNQIITPIMQSFIDLLLTI